MQIILAGNKPFAEYKEAKALGIETKPVVIGAYTLLKLCRYTGKKTLKDIAGSVAKAYQEFLHSCEEIGIPWIQFDEPSLVQDMDQEAISLFQQLYD